MLYVAANVYYQYNLKRYEQMFFARNVWISEGL